MPSSLGQTRASSNLGGCYYPEYCHHLCVYNPVYETIWQVSIFQVLNFVQSNSG